MCYHAIFDILPLCNILYEFVFFKYEIETLKKYQIDIFNCHKKYKTGRYIKTIKDRPSLYDLKPNEQSYALVEFFIKGDIKELYYVNKLFINKELVEYCIRTNIKETFRYLKYELRDYDLIPYVLFTYPNFLLKRPYYIEIKEEEIKTHRKLLKQQKLALKKLHKKQNLIMNVNMRERIKKNKKKIYIKK